MTYSPQKFLVPLETHSEWQIIAALDAVHLHRKRHPRFNWHSKNFADMQVRHREMNSLAPVCLDCQSGRRDCSHSH